MRGRKNETHHTLSELRTLAVPVCTGGAGGMPVVACADADELGVALVDSVYGTEDPAAVAREVCEVTSAEEDDGNTIDEAIEELPEGVTPWSVVATEVGLVLDEASLDVADATTVDVERGTLARDDEGLTIAVEDDATIALEGGTVEECVDDRSDDGSDDSTEVSSENVGKGRDETGTVTLLVMDAGRVEDMLLVAMTTPFDDELGAVTEETASTELGPLLVGRLADAEGVETWLDVCGGGTGITTVTKDEATGLETMLDPEAEAVGVTEPCDPGNEEDGTETEV